MPKEGNFKKAEYLNELKNLVNGIQTEGVKPEKSDLLEFLDREIARNLNTNEKLKNARKKKEVDPIKDAICDCLKAQSEPIMTSELLYKLQQAGMEDLNLSKLRARLAEMVKSGRINEGPLTANKKKTYFC